MIVYMTCLTCNVNLFDKCHKYICMYICYHFLIIKLFHIGIIFYSLYTKMLNTTNGALVKCQIYGL